MGLNSPALSNLVSSNTWDESNTAITANTLPELSGRIEVAGFFDSFADIISVTTIMNDQKPTLPKGMRDFGPDKMAKRNYIFNAIRATFEKFGFQPLETPTMENLSVLTGKYGDEGDQLLFKVLNSRDFLSKTTIDDFNEGYKKLLPRIAEKGLKYDLTVPFARFVVMNRNNLTFPFKRYQIQPVWRGDRPQKGRYREFYQCDADIIGTDSLLCEAEVFLMIEEVFEKLKIKDYDIVFNNRKILNGIAESIGENDKFSDLCVAIDKLDKIGVAKVIEELATKGFSTRAIDKIRPFLNLNGANEENIEAVKLLVAQSTVGMGGVDDLERIMEYVQLLGSDTKNLKFDPRLARGLSYYTGTILEVKINNVAIGSVSGGGRYDDLTGGFGMPGISGIGFSFGVDRIYDVLEELRLFPSETIRSTTVLIANFGKNEEGMALRLLTQMRDNGIKSEFYPDLVKLKKQMNYADKKNIPYVILIGQEELESQLITVKNMESGDQEKLSATEFITKLVNINAKPDLM